MLTEDGSIIHRCLNGEPEAFGLFVDKYKTGIYAFVYAKIHDFHHAQDVTQEVFLQAYLGLRNLRRWESFVFWLYRIASMQCRMWLRSHSRRPDSESIEDQDPAILEAPSLDAYRESQVSESLREALDALPEAYREVLLLHYFGGMTSKDIAGAIGISPVAVLKRLSRARSQLKEEMVDMVSKTFKRRRLPITFTFRIVEAVNRVKIQPMTQSRGLPWGLSLAAGIIVTILSFNPHLSMINPQGSPSGSPLPVETRVLETGEILAEVLKTSQMLAIASRPGDGDSGEIRPSDERGASFLAPQASEVKLKPRDNTAGDFFGYSVSIYGDYAIVGTPFKEEGKGTAYIFKHEGDSWKEQDVLFADDGEKYDWFGAAVAISNEFAVVGAPTDDDKGEDTGSVYVFRRTGETWIQQTKLNPHGQWIKWCWFGWDMAISGDYLVVGSPQEDGAGGAIYIFKCEGNTWKEEAKLESSDWEQYDRFGSSVSISGDYVIATAPYHDNETGSAYIYHLSEFFPVESSGSSATTFGGEKDRPALADTVIPPPVKQSIPMKFRLLQNFPNPFNPDTWLPYELASDADVMILIHNSNGDLVRRLNPGAQKAGFYTTRDKAACWDGRNEAGEYAASGVYFYTIQAGDFTARKKMTIVE